MCYRTFAEGRELVSLRSFFEGIYVQISGIYASTLVFGGVMGVALPFVFFHDLDLMYDSQ